jgi:tetratricopeptide (TPR) repeat protein
MPDTGVLIDGGAPASPSAHEQLREAEGLRESGQLDAAERLYRAVLEYAPANRGALLGLGFSARKRGERPAALDFFRRAASLDPQDRFARLAAADELRELGCLDEAEAQYRDVIAAEPLNRSTLIGLALTARKRGDRAGALALFRWAADGDPDNTFIALALGDELRETGDIEGAERQYRTLLDRMPQNFGVLLGLGLCARRRGDRVRALEYFRGAAAADPKAVFPLLAAADELRELGRIDEAEAEYSMVLASNPGHEKALLGFGLCARRRGDRKSALDWFRRAAATEPANVFYTLAIGDELFHLWRLDEAEVHYRRALDDAPVSARALLGLGELRAASRRSCRRISLLRGRRPRSRQ